MKMETGARALHAVPRFERPLEPELSGTARP